MEDVLYYKCIKMTLPIQLHGCLKITEDEVTVINPWDRVRVTEFDKSVIPPLLEDNIDHFEEITKEEFESKLEKTYELEKFRTERAPQLMIDHKDESPEKISAIVQRETQKYNIIDSDKTNEDA